MNVCVRFKFTTYIYIYIYNVKRFPVLYSVSNFFLINSLRFENTVLRVYIYMARLPYFNYVFGVEWTVLNLLRHRVLV